MASVEGNLSFSLADVEGVKASMSLPVEFGDGVTLAQLDTAWNTMAGLVDAITGAQIQRGKVSFGQVIPVVAGVPTIGKAAPAAGSEVERVGLFNFGITGSTHRQGIVVPGLSPTKITAGRIALGDADVTAFTNAISAAIAGGGVFSTPEGLALLGLLDAALAFRKHRRQLRALSFEL